MYSTILNSHREGGYFMNIFQNTKASLNVEKLYDIDGYITFKIKVASSGFNGISNFCISKLDINDIQRKLQYMDEKLEGSVIINDMDSDSFLKFELKEHGQLVCSGELGGSHRDHSMKFSFQADQTILAILRGYLNGQ